MWDRPLSVAMLALGGQGGGVLTKWLVDIAEHQGFLAQSTYVAGVAQRTGATVYCVEMFPQAEAEKHGNPVFTPYPVPGDIDLVITGEFAETGRAILKGFVTPNATTLIASSHRVYSIDEKSALGDGRLDQSTVLRVAREVSKELICFDMEQAAEDAGSIISAVMLGAIAASRALPFERSDFEDAIRRGAKAVSRNLAGFDAGYRLATAAPAVSGGAQAAEMPHAEGAVGEALLRRTAKLPQPARISAGHGALRALDYQDEAYAYLYLDRVELCAAADNATQNHELTEVFARNLALQMCYEDTLRVADLKTRASRFARVREHLGVADDQPAYIVEYFHPRYEEVCDTMPAAIGRKMAESARLRRWLAPLFRKGRNVTTNKIGGYLLLSVLSGFRRWRRSTYRFALQQEFITSWIEQVIAAARDDYRFAVALCDCMDIVRGYGDTYERGRTRFETATRLARASEVGNRADILRRLHKAALADEDGNRFHELQSELEAEIEAESVAV